jgi:hypothetical protein
LLGLREGWGNEHVLHPRRLGRGDARGGILEDKALFRSDVHSQRSFEKWIRRGFAATVILRGHDGVEKLDDAQRAQGVEHNAAMATRGHGHRFAARKGFGDRDHGLDRRDLGTEFEEDRFLVRDGLREPAA